MPEFSETQGVESMRSQIKHHSMPSCRLAAITASCLILVTVEVRAQSGGLSLPEDGSPINGTAQAGSAAIARDAQTAWLNPAGMTRLDSIELMLTVRSPRISS